MLYAAGEIVTKQDLTPLVILMFVQVVLLACLVIQGASRR